MDLSAIISALKDFETFGKNIVGLFRFVPDFLLKLTELNEKATGLTPEAKAN